MDSSKLEELTKTGKEIRVLCVEDDEGARSGMAMLLENFFPNVLTGIDGKDGLAKFNNSEFDLILTDLDMPNMDGIEMIREIRKTSKDVQIVIISAITEAETLSEIKRLDVIQHLPKPINIPEFIEILLESVRQIKQKKTCE